jgi:UDP-3-O-[3-hydroxymyristoyl] glucosamine N-acyltransferase
MGGMTEPFYFEPARRLTVGDIVRLTGAEALEGTPLDRPIGNVATLDRAGPHDLTFLDNPKYADQLAATRAGACLTTQRFEQGMPDGLAVLRARDPYRAFVLVMRELYPDALRPSSLFDAKGVAPGTFVHASARLENGVAVDPGAVIGPRAEIGSGSVIGPNAVIGPKVRIGRDCSIGAGTTLMHCLIGDHVIIHPGCHLGQDGFGYVVGKGAHMKVPQIGRVIIQDHVEIGAGTTVDRGAIRDTVIGEGTKIDNLVQVGHNVCIGRHCLIVAQTAMAGSSALEDFVVLGGRVAVNNHVTVGEGARIAATSNVNDDVPAGGRYGGTPAKPVRQWIREMLVLEQLAQENRNGGSPAAGPDDR